MAPLTAKGRTAAMRGLRERRKRNLGRPPFDNSSLHAGEPMFFPCAACGDDIRHPEDYINRIWLCIECEAMKACGWLTR